MKKKRLFAFLILSVVFVFAFFPIKTFAKQKADSKTECRHLIEYTELSMKRYMEFERKYNREYNIYVSSPFTPFRETKDEFTFDSTFGTITVDKEDFTVSRVVTIMSKGNDSSQNNEKYLFQCISAMSALEYDEHAESMLEIEYKVKKTGASSAFEKTLEIWREEIQPGIKEAFKNNSSIDADPVKLYSGNYDYYVSSIDTGKGIINFFIAQKR